jgi:hypothetical protein
MIRFFSSVASVFDSARPLHESEVVWKRARSCFVCVWLPSSGSGIQGGEVCMPDTPLTSAEPMSK